MPVRCRIADSVCFCFW